MSGASPSFTIRILKVVFTWVDGSTHTFDGSPGALAPFRPGLQIEVDIENALLPTIGGNAYIRIYGLTLSEINQLSVAGKLWRPVASTKVQVFAGNTASGSNLTLIYSGQVLEAKPEFGQMPSTSFFINSLPGLMLQMDNTVKPVSINGSASAKTILQQLCGAANITLDYTGDDVQIAYHHGAGSAADQIEDVIYAARLRSYFEPATSTLHVFPQTGSVGGGTVTISPQNGMIGYPDFQSNQVTVRTIFDPAIASAAKGPGHQIQIQSQLAAASGTFVISSMRYHLSCNNPDGGPWELEISAYPQTVGASGDP